MSDILYEAAVEYQKLKKTIYDIVLGRKGSTYHIKLRFPAESFFHLTGLQHLEDLTFPSTNKERIFKEILNKNFTIEDAKKSIHYEEYFIEERVTNLKHLKSMIESNAVYYRINKKKYIQYTKIFADYLCEHHKSEKILYLFLVMENSFSALENEAKGCSFFVKHRYDYTNGTAKTTTLLIEKYEDEKEEIIFRNPTYIE